MPGNGTHNLALGVQSISSLQRCRRSRQASHLCTSGREASHCSNPQSSYTRGKIRNSDYYLQNYCHCKSAYAHSMLNPKSGGMVEKSTHRLREFLSTLPAQIKAFNSPEMHLNCWGDLQRKLIEDPHQEIFCQFAYRMVIFGTVHISMDPNTQTLG